MDKPVTVYKICGGRRGAYHSACGYNVRYCLRRYVEANFRMRPELYVFATEEDARNSPFVGTLFKARARDEMPPFPAHTPHGTRCYRRVKLLKNLGPV